MDDKRSTEINPHEPGAKLDQDKNRCGLVITGFARALQEVSKVGTFGAKKYSDAGWTQVVDGERRYTDAMFRHLLAEAAGEVLDPESGLPHAAHAAWCALARLDLHLRAREPNLTDSDDFKLDMEALSTAVQQSFTKALGEINTSLLQPICASPEEAKAVGRERIEPSLSTRAPRVTGQVKPIPKFKVCSKCLARLDNDGWCPHCQEALPKPVAVKSFSELPGVCTVEDSLHRKTLYYCRGCREKLGVLDLASSRCPGCGADLSRAWPRPAEAKAERGSEDTLS